MTSTTLARFANLRDVGGLPTETGGRTRSAVLLRSEAPSPGDVVDTVAWPPGSVIDLRTDWEIRWTSPLVALGAEVIRMPLTDLLSPEAQVNTYSSIDLAELYELILRAGDQWLPQLVATAAHGPGPVLVHCAAGKDRTGVAVAVLLRAAGVTRQAVEADFDTTNAHRDALFRRLRAQGTIDDDVDPELVGVDLANLRPLLDAIDRDGPRRLLLEAGVPDVDIDAWRARIAHG